MQPSRAYGTNFSMDKFVFLIAFRYSPVRKITIKRLGAPPVPLSERARVELGERKRANMVTNGEHSVGRYSAPGIKTNRVYGRVPQVASGGFDKLRPDVDVRRHESGN
jgi:hypothetical protein